MRKTIKKIAALAAGFTMLGATMFSALAAADLSTYPAPFVKDGKFDAFIVVGENAQSEDVVGAVDIGASLQFEMRKEQSLGTNQNIIISDGVKIKGTGSQVFNYGETYGDVRSSVFDAEDLPVLLADGRYVESEGQTDNDEDYVQELQLSNSSGLGTYDQPDDDYNGDTYLEIFDNEPAYTYSLTFDNPVEYALDGNGAMQYDIEGTQIEIQGNLYTITNVKFYSDDTIKEINLMAGDTLLWLMQDEIVEKTVNGVTHEIKVVDVTDNEDSCGVSVDGYVAWIDVKSDKTINGLNIGVLDAKAVHAQLQDVDICQLNLGATEIRLPHSDNVVRDGQEIEDAEVTIFNEVPGQWGGFSVEYTPQEDIYMKAGNEMIDPSFGNFKIMMGNLTASYEDIKVKNSGSKKGMVTFDNNDGKSVEVPYYVDTSAGTIGGWGVKNDKQMLFEGHSCTGTVDVEDCKGTLLYVINSGGTAHILELTKIDMDDMTVSIKDLTYNRQWNDQTILDDISMGSLGKITLDMDDYTITAVETDSDGNQAETKNAGTVMLTASAPGPIPDDTYITMLTFTENKDFSNKQTITVEGKWDSSDKAIEIHLNTAGTTYVAEGVDKIADVDYPQVYATEYGTLVEVDEEDKIEIFHPEDQAEINAFIAPVSAEIRTQGWSTISIDKINVGAARLDSEITDYTKENLILVGGPCANTVAADVMGVEEYEPNCYAGLQIGDAIIKLYEHNNGKVSMVVAGMTAMDTRRATRVISNFDAYALHGKEAKVSGTSLADIKVSMPS